MGHRRAAGVRRQGHPAVEFFEHAEKTYEATLRLGMKTDTQDITGTVLEERPVTGTEQDILNVLPAFGERSCKFRLCTLL